MHPAASMMRVQITADEVHEASYCGPSREANHPNQPPSHMSSGKGKPYRNDFSISWPTRFCQVLRKQALFSITTSPVHRLLGTKLVMAPAPHSWPIRPAWTCKETLVDPTRLKVHGTATWVQYCRMNHFEAQKREGRSEKRLIRH